MENKMNIISKIYEITDGKNIADLINEFETNYKYNINLKYIDVYKAYEYLVRILLGQIRNLLEVKYEWF